MISKHRPIWAKVELDKLRHNIREIQKFYPDKRILSVIKGDAYGHGMIEVNETLREEGIKDFAVAIPQEAITLRQVDPDSSILILGYTSPAEVAEVIAADCTIAVSSYEEAALLCEASSGQGKKIKLAIDLDTGMTRMGFDCTKEAIEEVVKVSLLPNVVMEEAFSHFSTADDEDLAYSKIQLERFKWFFETLKERGVVFNHYHLANSASMEHFPEALEFDTVRPGLVQYGYHSTQSLDVKMDLRPVLSLHGRIVRVREIPPNTPVSYGNTWVSESRTVIATVPLGYADGYSRALSNKGQIFIHGIACPVRGRICMDQCMIDVTAVPDVKVGDKVEILGEGYDAEDMARDLDTISYEVLASVGVRIPRVYSDGDETL